ncbi:MAG: ribonuclease P protein component [Acidobacteriota bacterium]|nr:ribonuclease P protein component [Acidobacteriota bacterium]
MKQFGFSWEERLHTRKEYLAVYRNGYRVFTPYFVLYFRENGRTRSRLGIAASRKVGPPVVRNRIRRRLRESFRMNKRGILPCSDVVVNVRRGAVAATFQELQGEFLRMVSRWNGRRQGA